MVIRGFLLLIYAVCVLAYQQYNDLEVEFGKAEGISRTSTISQENLKKILQGVENGNKENIYFYGLLKLYGISVSQDLLGASQSFSRASALGHKEATTAYGVMLLTGNGLKQDTSSALQYFRKAVALGDMNAHWLLGKMLIEGRGLQAPAYKEAATLFNRAAEENIPQAIHHLAIMYEYGQGVQQNFAKAMSLYRRGAEQLNVESMYNLAMMYAYGRGDTNTQEFERARSLLETCAQLNHAPSIYYIGIFKTYGYGCKVSYEQAINWFERAAGLDDHRVSAKAARAAEELRSKVLEANTQNDHTLNTLAAQADVAGTSR